MQLEAIAAELNIFLAEKIVTRKRVGFVVEVRSTVAAEAAFFGRTAGARRAAGAGRGAGRAPDGVARRQPARRRSRRCTRSASLGVEAAGDRRGASCCATSGPDLAAMIGAPDPALRLAAVRVIGRRVRRARPDDAAIEQTVGDAVITALNDRDRAVRAAAMRGARRDALRARACRR